MKKIVALLGFGILALFGLSYATPVDSAVGGARAVVMASMYGEVNDAVSGYKSSFNIPRKTRRVGIANRTAATTVLYVSMNRASIFGTHANELATVAATATATLDAAITGLRVGDILNFTEAGADYGPHMITNLSADGLTVTLNPAPTLTTANMDFNTSEIVVPAATAGPLWFEVAPTSIGVGASDDDCAYTLLFEYIE